MYLDTALNCPQLTINPSKCVYGLTNFQYTRKSI